MKVPEMWTIVPYSDRLKSMKNADLTSSLTTFAAGAHAEGKDQFRWLMSLTLSGMCHRFAGNSSTIPVKKWDVLFIRPGVSRSWRVPSSAGHWRPIWVFFNPRDYVLEWMRFPEAADGVYKLKLEGALIRSMVKNAMLEAHRLAIASFPGHAELAMNALERAILWCRSGHLRKLKPLDPRVDAALHYLHQRINEPGMRITDVVNACRTSRSRLLDLFHRQTGMSLMNYLEQERMRRAGQLLSTRMLSVKQVAMEVGFTDQKYFARRFKLATGNSPRRFQQR